MNGETLSMFANQPFTNPKVWNFYLYLSYLWLLCICIFYSMEFPQVKIPETFLSMLLRVSIKVPFEIRQQFDVKQPRNRLNITKLNLRLCY